MNIAILGAIFGQTKKKQPLPRAAPARLSPPLMEGSEWPCKLLWIVIRNFVLEDGARRPPSYYGGCIRLDKNLLLSAKIPKSIHMVHPSKYVRQYLAQVLQ